MQKRGTLFLTVVLAVHGLSVMAADAHDGSRNMGKVAGYCIIGILVLAVIKRLTGKGGS